MRASVDSNRSFIIFFVHLSTRPLACLLIIHPFVVSYANWLFKSVWADGYRYLIIFFWIFSVFTVQFIWIQWYSIVILYLCISTQEPQNFILVFWYFECLCVSRLSKWIEPIGCRFFIKLDRISMATCISSIALEIIHQICNV